MIWHGYIYYIIFNFILFIFFYPILKKVLYGQSVSSTKLTNFILAPVMFFILISFSLLNTLFNDSDISIVSSVALNTLSYSTMSISSGMVPGYNILYVYVYPFIYIFVLITSISIIYCLSYNNTEVNGFMLFILTIFFSGYVLFFTDSLIIFFFSYEMLLVPSFFILYRFAKTKRTIEASYLMFFWTQFGAMFLIIAFMYIFYSSGTQSFSRINDTFFSEWEINFIFSCLIIGFGVKLPIWPFYGWLPKAHVEASTNFSIFLSGVLVKFAFFGLFKCLIILKMEPTLHFIYPFLFVGILDSVIKIFYQTDLKKLVAYSTVVEMHWLVMCTISGQSNLLIANICMLISHAILSTNSFLIVDAISRRYKTRLITEVSGINFLNPKLFIIALVNTLIFLGFPGSLFFVSEFIFFSFYFDLFPIQGLLLIVLLYLTGPSFYFKSWINVLFGMSNNFTKNIKKDLTCREFLLFSSLTALLYWLGFNWQFFII